MTVNKTEGPNSFGRFALRSATFVLTVFIFFFALKLLSVACAGLGIQTAQSIFGITTNPFIGLFIGIVVTAILQSSSTTTSMTVALVAANSLELSQAIPIVLGANIGTALTSSIVSLSYITKSHEFRKAISAGTVHHIYNILVVILLLPLELNYHVLTNLSIGIAQSLPQLTGSGAFPYTFGLLEPLGNIFVANVGFTLSLIIAFGLLFASVKIISQLTYNRWIDPTKTKFESAYFNNTFKSFGWGLAITAIIQSSSLSTSLMVPLVATGKIRIRRAFEFILGSNLGTTITALLAAVFTSEAAISLAIAHLLFNVFGVCLFLFIPYLSNIPTYLSDYLGKLTLRSRAVGFTYILLTFFIIPYTLIYLSSRSNTPDARTQIEQPVPEKQDGFLED